MERKIKVQDIYGNEYVVSIFLIVLGNSRFKYIELTFEQTQSTLFKCMNHAFEYFGGTTEEILFDNMKIIVNQTKSSFQNLILNSKAEQYAKDVGFKIRTCLPYKPRTKGETLAKIMNRLKAFDKEFKDIKELDNIVKRLNYSLNFEEKSQAINDIPYNLFQKEYLIPVNTDILKNYYIPEKSCIQLMPLNH